MMPFAFGTRKGTIDYYFIRLICSKKGGRSSFSLSEFLMAFFFMPLTLFGVLKALAEDGLDLLQGMLVSR